MRSSGFLFALALPAYLAWTVHAGYWTMRHGIYGAAVSDAYLGVLSALLSGTLLSLIGFYFVKNAVALDRRSGVGGVLAATPLSTRGYLAGQALGNFLLLAAMVAVVALAAAWMGSRAPAAPGFGVHGMLAAFALLALPLMAVVAALAVAFEAVPWLRGGFGNVVWFFLWGIGLAQAIRLSGPLLDFTGVSMIQDSLLAALHEHYPGAAIDGISLSADDPARARVQHVFPWDGPEWKPLWLASRIAWIGFAAMLAVAPAGLFDRFDPPRGRIAGEQDAAAQRRWRLPRMRIPGRAVLLIELRLLLGGQPRLWSAGLVASWIAQIAAPLDAVRSVVLPIAWIWPLLVWSRMGARDREHGTEALFDAAPHPVARQLPAAFGAGVLVAVLAAAPALARLTAAGPVEALPVWLAAAFVPALALACGLASGTSRLFEALYLLLWYVGPLNRVPALDFIGATQAARDAGTPFVVLAATAMLLGLAALVRMLRPRR